MKLMLLTSDIDFIKEAQSAGVDRIFLDLEYINKVERQMGRSAVISQNNIEDVARLRPYVDKSEFLVRINPMNPNSKEEIEKVIAGGADIIMLPMVLDEDDAKQFADIVGNRAKKCLLLETSQALARLDDILEVDGIDEMYIGLNDLHICMKLDFMFELLSGGIVEYMCNKIKSKGLSYGFGGMAKIGEGILPAERILGEHYRLGSSCVILSRVFRNESESDGQKVDLQKEIAKIREKEMELSSWSEDQFEENRKYVKECVNKILKK